MDALWFGCVPVIISDRYILPLENLLNWDEIAYRIPESQVSNNQCLIEINLLIQLSHPIWMFDYK